MEQLALLTEELKTELRNQLERNQDLRRDQEFIRITNLEREIVNKYGFEGIKLVLEHDEMEDLVELGKFPEDCPWYSYNDKTIYQLIDQNFVYISHKLPELVDALLDRCKFIFAGKKEGHWFLNYFLDTKLHDGRDYYRIYEGGVPNLDPVRNENLVKYNWDIPRDLCRFYCIHDGFGDEGNYILGSHDIWVMSEVMDPICKELNTIPENYAFKDLLEFFPDGLGNAQCFHINNNDLTVDWDHETWEISKEVDFYTFIDERMSHLDEDPD